MRLEQWVEAKARRYKIHNLITFFSTCLIVVQKREGYHLT